MKKLIQYIRCLSLAEGNHELWYECSCGAVYDRRRQGNVCPQCGITNATTKTWYRLILLIVLIAAGLYSSCSGTKYAVRHHHNLIAQQVIQHEHEQSGGSDWVRWQHNQTRPGGHWPMNWAQ